MIDYRIVDAADPSLAELDLDEWEYEQARQQEVERVKEDGMWLMVAGNPISAINTRWVERLVVVRDRAKAYHLCVDMRSEPGQDGVPWMSQYRLSGEWSTQEGAESALIELIAATSIGKETT